MKRRLLARVCAVWVWGAVCGATADPGARVVSLGDNERAKEVLILREEAVRPLAADRQSGHGLVELAQERDSVVLYYDNARGGVVGFIGARRIAYAGPALVDQWQRRGAGVFKRHFAENLPMSYEAFKLQRKKPRSTPWPKRPVQLTPTMLCLPLEERPADFMVVESKRGVRVVQVVSVADDGSRITLKLHVRHAR